VQLIVPVIFTSFIDMIHCRRVDGVVGGGAGLVWNRVKQSGAGVAQEARDFVLRALCVCVPPIDMNVGNFIFMFHVSLPETRPA